MHTRDTRLIVQSNDLILKGSSGLRRVLALVGMRDKAVPTWCNNEAVLQVGKMHFKPHETSNGGAKSHNHGSARNKGAHNSGSNGCLVGVNLGGDLP
jgi:hypothetical protein